MPRMRLATPAGPRPGVILLVVISMLVLFSLVGIAFVVYAEGQANTARIWREGESLVQPDMDPELLLAYFLGQLVYDTDNPHSAMRGHSLARNMYGRPGNTIPFNGSGRVHTAGAGNEANDDYFKVDYTAYPWNAGRNPDQYGSPNPPYTYPDFNHMFLAGQRASDGAVLIPSFSRTRPDGVTVNLRPSTAYHTSFPPVAHASGDVKNLADSPGFGGGPNDSIWMDLGFPVMTAPDGRKFKPLFAPLILDLDNRINVNVHGNKFGTWNTTAGGGLGNRATFWSTSEHGWGPWEVNPYKVLRGMEGGSINEWDSEWRRLLLGNTTVQGRYDSQAWFFAVKAPVLPPAEYWIKGKYYSMTDANCHICGKGNLSLPGAPRFQWFPWYQTPGSSPDCPFPSAHLDYGRDNFTGGDETPYPNFYNFFDPTGWNIFVAGVKDRRFEASHLEALLRYRDTGSPALESDLFALCPLSFGDPVLGPRGRRLVTTHAFDIERPGVLPFVWDRTANAYGLAAATSTYPTGPAATWPGTPLPAPPAGSEFAPSYQAVTAALGRIDLNRKLPDYPGPDGNTMQIAAGNIPAFQTAEQARQEFAQELFDCLRAVTGAADPATAAPGTPDFHALRWLAQLSVNIVDFLDNDHYMTPFKWSTAGAGVGQQWVFGTEMPWLVLNEVYAEISNDPADPKTGGRATMPYKVRFWVELHNPLRADIFGNLSEGGNARLQTPNGTAVYQIVVAEGPNPISRRPGNVLGDPDPARIKTVVAKWEPEPAPVAQPTIGSAEYVKVKAPHPRSSGVASGAAGNNQGWYLAAPKDDPDGATGWPQPTLRIKDQSINGTRSSLVYEAPTSTDLAALPRHTLLLRRLACTAMPHQSDPAVANYNPYITVDYADEVATNDAVANDATAARQPTALTTRAATGRNQPYAADVSMWNSQSDPAAQLTGQPQHTFFKKNYKAVTPFDWLMFLDRGPHNAMELLQVSAFKPHELTQMFMTGGVDAVTGQPKNKHMHQAPWFDSSARIYRLLEFLRGGHRIQGVSLGGKTLGKININTVWDVETFRALFDARPSDYFTESDVDQAFSDMLRTRSPGVAPGPNDRPFRGMAVPHAAPGDMQYPAGSGIDDTFLRGAGDAANPARRLFEVAALPNYANGHPFTRYHMMTKIFGNTTTRSNVFAAWVTVGFFEVLSDGGSGGPPVLGQEIGRSSNRHIRHRMFAIIDRTNLTLDPANPRQPGTPAFFFDTMTAVTNTGAPSTIRVPAVSGNYENYKFRIQANDRLMIDAGPRQEVITVTGVNVAANQITATFTKKHQNVGVPITNVGGTTQMGHPGPQPRFDPRNPVFSGLVRFMSIIE